MMRLQNHHSARSNSYLLYQISNDRDKELVHKLVPDNLRGLLPDLPSLPSRHALPLNPDISQIRGASGLKT